MISHITLPEYGPHILQCHWDVHYAHFVRYAEAANIPVSLTTSSSVWAPKRHVPNYFSMELEVNSKQKHQLIIDFADKYSEGLQRFDQYSHYVKMQYTHECRVQKRLYPSLPPFDVKDPEDRSYFFELSTQQQYTASGNTILCAQRPHTRALIRRTQVHHKLKKAYGNRVDTRLTSQRNFWVRHKDCLVAVVVPGATNHIFDRGHFEQLALGVCTLCPRIETILPYWKMLEPDIHYIRVKDDYSDLCEKIEWCRAHREECRTIGRAAQTYIQSLCFPHAYWSWIEHIIS